MGTTSRGIWPVICVQFLYFLGIAIALPSFPFIWTTTPLASGDDIKGASLHSLATTFNAICELLSASFLGVLSDHFGRKPFLIMSSMGQVIDFLIGGLAAKDRDDYFFSLEEGHLWMFFARSIAGLCGNMVIFTKSYVADVSPPQQRSTNFAKLAVCVGFAFVAGPPIGIFLSSASLQLPLFAAAALNVVNTLIACRLEESLRPEDSVPIHWRGASPIGSLTFLVSEPFLKVFAFMSFLDQLAMVFMQTIFLQYVVSVYGVERPLATILLVEFGIGQGLAFLFVLRPLVSRYGELPAIKVGYVMTMFKFISLAVLSYQTYAWPLVVVMIFAALGAISNPAQNGVASRCVGKSMQGKLQAATGSLAVICKIVGAGVVAAVFEPSTRAGHPGALWWIASAITFLGVCVSFKIDRYLPPMFYHGENVAKEDDIAISETLSTS